MWLWCTFWCVLPWVQLLWDALSFLDFLEVYFFCQIREGLLHYVFKSVFNYLLFLFSFWHPSDVGTIKVVPEVPKPLLIFLNSCFFILFWLNVYFFLLFQITDLSLGFLLFTVESLYIFLISLCITFTSSFILHLYSTILWASWLPVFWTLHLIGCLSPHCLVLLLEFWSLLSFGPCVFVLVHLLYWKGWGLRYSPGQATRGFEALFTPATILSCTVCLTP